MRTRKSKLESIISTKVVESMIVILTTIVTLKCFNVAMKLGFDEGRELEKYIVYL